MVPVREDNKQCKFVKTIKKNSHCFLGIFCFIFYLFIFFLLDFVLFLVLFVFIIFIFFIVFLFCKMYLFNVYLELHSRIPHTMSSLHILGHAILNGALNCC